MNSVKAFVYFVENEIVEGLLPNWPSGMKLALVLHKSGQCELIVFHRNETRRLIKRMDTVLGLPLGHFGIVPEIQGYPTKVIRFSDQQQLMNLIEDKDDLCEQASDYAINYRFAEEEGLDPVRFTSLAHKNEVGLENIKTKNNVLVKPFETRRLKSQAPLQFKRSSKNRQVKADIPFRGTFAEIARIENQGAYVHLTLNPESSTEDLKVLQATDVVAEFGRLQLARPLLGQWKLGASVMIQIPIDKLPDDPSPDYFAQPYIAAVLIAPDGIFVTCGSKAPTVNSASDHAIPMNYPFHRNAKRGLTFANDQKRF